MTQSFRFENDSIGTVEVPKKALWGAQTQRSLTNFAIGDSKVPLNDTYISYFGEPDI